MAAHRDALPRTVGHLLAGDIPRFWIARRLLQFARSARRAGQNGQILRLARAADLRLAAAINLWSDQLGAGSALDAFRCLAAVGRAVVGQFSGSACARLVV